MTAAQIKQMFEIAYVKSLPKPVQALFKFFDSPPGVPNVYFDFSPAGAAAQTAKFEELVNTYAGVMITDIMRDQVGPWWWFTNSGLLLRAGLPPANAISLGYNGQFAQPGEPPLPGMLGAYPTVEQPGWVKIALIPAAWIKSPATVTEAQVSAFLQANFPAV
jgi:hypothetical protein